MRYVLIGAALSGNKGAAAMVEATVHNLTALDPDATFTLLTSSPARDAELNDSNAVEVMDAAPSRLTFVVNPAALLHLLIPPMRRLIERAVPAVSAIARADVHLDLSGISFMDSRNNYVLYHVARTLPPLLLRTPSVRLAQALGPFDRMLNRLAAKWLLPRMSAIIARGNRTRYLLQSIGLTNVHDGADLALTLHVTADAAREAERSIDTSFLSESPTIGYAPSSVLEQEARARGDDYAAEVVRQIDHITGALGRRVLVVAHAARAGSERHVNNDLPLCRRIVAAVSHRDRVHFIDAELSAGAQRHLIGLCDIFVASRFHAMISAISEGVPVLVIGWSHKYEEVLAMFGLERRALPHEQLTHSVFVDSLRDVLATAAATRSELALRVPRVRALAMQQFDLVNSIASRRRDSLRSRRSKQ